jgi:hypothetical protein
MHVEHMEGVQGRNVSVMLVGVVPIAALSSLREPLVQLVLCQPQPLPPAPLNQSPQVQVPLEYPPLLFQVNRFVADMNDVM